MNASPEKPAPPPIHKPNLNSLKSQTSQRKNLRRPKKSDSSENMLLTVCYEFILQAMVLKLHV